jgi:hypothetical protein
MTKLIQLLILIAGGFTCPNCRTKITGLGRSLHLENLIEALFQGVDLQAKEDRDRLLRERQGKTFKGSSFLSLTKYIIVSLKTVLGK